jgi:hypothetical protein
MRAGFHAGHRSRDREKSRKVILSIQKMAGKTLPDMDSSTSC